MYFLFEASNENPLEHFSNTLTKHFKTTLYKENFDLACAIYQNNLTSMQLITKRLFVYNCALMNTNLNTKYDSTFREFLALRVDECPDETVTALMQAWNNFHYKPREEAIIDLKMFLYHSKRNAASAKPWRVNNVRISLNGHTENNLKMPTVKYLRKDLDNFAALLLKAKLGQNENMRDLLENTIVKTDRLLKQKKFDFIIDGLNMICSYTLKFEDNFSRIIANLNLNKKYLITLR